MTAFRAALACMPVLAVAAAPALAQDARPVAEILRDFQSVHFPAFSGGSDPEAVAAFRRAVEDAARRQCALALELFEAHPAHAAVPELLGKRWALTVNTFHEPARVLEETARVLDGEPRDELRVAALHGGAWAALQSGGDLSARTKLDHVQRVFEADPDNSRCGHYFVELLQTEAIEPDAMRALAGSVVARWPDDPWAARPAQALVKQLDKIGAPLPVDLDELLGADAGAGHTVVVFWSFPSDAVGAKLREVQGWTERFGGLRAAGVVNYRIDGGVDALAKHLEDWEVGFPQLYDEAQIQKPWESPYRTPRTPFYYLLGPDGNVLRFAYDARVMAQLLGEVLEPRRSDR